MVITVASLRARVQIFGGQSFHKVGLQTLFFRQERVTAEVAQIQVRVELKFRQVNVLQVDCIFEHPLGTCAAKDESTIERGRSRCVNEPGTRDANYSPPVLSHS